MKFNSFYLLMSRKRCNFAHMIEIERHIEILLLSNDCVIVPGLGGFMAHHMSARYDEADRLFLPPLRTLGFNPQLQLNDHLLVQSYIETYDISYPEALRRIEEEVAELKQHVEAEGEYDLNGIGVLRMNDEGHYEFEPCEAGILTPEFYGLSTFEMPTLQQLLAAQQTVEDEPAQVVTLPAKKQEAVAEEVKLEDAQEPDRQEPDTLVIRMSWVRNFVAAAAAVLAFFIISNPVTNSNDGMEVQQSSMISAVASHENSLQHNASADQTENQIVAKNNPCDYDEEMQAENAVETPTSIAETPKAEPVKAVAERYTIVLASQTPMKHAEEFMARLSKKGFSQMTTMEMASSSKVRVVYGNYASETDAQNELRSLRQKDSSFREAWVLKIKQ